jgi:hypothetical protein
MCMHSELKNQEIGIFHLHTEVEETQASFNQRMYVSIPCSHTKVMLQCDYTQCAKRTALYCKTNLYSSFKDNISIQLRKQKTPTKLPAIIKYIYIENIQCFVDEYGIYFTSETESFNIFTSVKHK